MFFNVRNWKINWYIYILLFNNKNENSSDSIIIWIYDKFLRCYVDWKKLVLKDYILYSFVCIMLWEKSKSIGKREMSSILWFMIEENVIIICCMWLYVYLKR